MDCTIEKLKKIAVASLFAFGLTAYNGYASEPDITRHSGCDSTEYSDKEEWEHCSHVAPEFPGGRDEVIKFLINNLEYPSECVKQKIEGRVIVSFIVDKDDGSLQDIKVVKSVHPLLDEEAMRVVSIMPNWTPGYFNGNPVSVRYMLPVTFKSSK